jgi:hypothetical protein
MDILNLKNLYSVMVKEEYHVKTSEQFVALEYLDDNKYINSLDSIGEYTNFS